MRTKQCSKCLEFLPISEFYKRKASKDGLRPNCKLCKKADALRYYRENRESIVQKATLHSKKYQGAYRKTKKGFVMKTYASMLARVKGQITNRPQYKGLPILPKQSFYDWTLSDPTFHRLFEAWEISGYELKLTPSIDRIDSSRGYSSDNVQWLTFSDNSKKG